MKFRIFLLVPGTSISHCVTSSGEGSEIVVVLSSSLRLSLHELCQYENEIFSRETSSNEQDAWNTFQGGCRPECLRGDVLTL